MIIYASRTGNVKSICDKLDSIKCVDVLANISPSEEYFIFTYTDGLGDIPSTVKDFLDKGENKYFLRGVIASGNTNFGKSYCLSADKISRIFNVPIIAKVELRGNKKDISRIEEQYNKIIKKKRVN